MKARLWVDGAARGNPGPAGVGVVVEDQQGRVLAEVAEYLGETTNNVAEYQALLRGLREAQQHGATEIEVFADSTLLVRQVTGAYKVKAAHLAALHAQVLATLSSFRSWTLTFVPRDRNARADALANRAIDEHAGVPRHTAAPVRDGDGTAAPATARDLAGLQPRLEAVARRLDGTLGLGVKTTWDGRTFYLRPDRVFPTASVFKVPVLLELLMQAEEGRLSLNERVPLTELDKAPGSGVLKELTSGPSLSLADLAMLMIIVSDNTATDILVRRLGTDAINRRLAGWGFERTRVAMDCRALLFDLAGRPATPYTPEARLEVEHALRRRPRVFSGRAYADADNNVSTPREMLALLDMLITPGRLPAGVQARALDIMRRQQVRDRLPFHLPPSAEIAHKTGSIGGVRNDVGILFVERGPVLVAAFTRDLKDDVAGSAAIAEIGRLLYGAFASDEHPRRH